MKLLYIAPFKDFSGYATASRGYLKALHMAGANITARAVRYDMADPGTQYTPTELEKSLLAKSLDGFDAVIQHVTPNEMRPVKNGAQNIAVCAWETDRIPKYWADRLNLFDKVITFCQTTKKAFLDSGVTRPIFVIPHCFDMSSYDLVGVKPLQVGDPVFLRGKHIFYNISQFSQKKGLDVLVKAYLSEFANDDDVLLIMKTYIGMSGRNNEHEKVVGFINQIKGALKFPKYPQIVVITQTMTDEQIKRMHATGHTYVCSSRGEGWNIPAFEALAYKRKLVTTDWGGMSEFIKSPSYGELYKGYYPNVFSVTGSLEPVFGQGHPDPDLYTGREKWFEPSITSMGKAMRQAKNSPIINSVANLHQFDHSIVGKHMLEAIRS